MQLNRQPTQEEGGIRVLIVDDHAVLRHGIATLIEDEEGLTVCGEAGDSHSALEQAEAKNPHVALVDLSLGLDDGLELIEHLKRTWVGLRTIVVTARPASGFARRAMNAGADGFVTKDEAMDHLVDAIRSVAAGESFLSPRPADILNRR